jgi:hypothetical protein
MLCQMSRGERQALDAAKLELNRSARGGGVSCRGLLEHFLRAINACDPARYRLLRQHLNADTRPETNFQHAVTKLNGHELDDTRSDGSICSRHDDAAQLYHSPLRTPERAHQQSSQGTRSAADRMPQR